VGPELFHEGGRADEQTAMMKLKVAFRNFAKAPKNSKYVRENLRDSNFLCSAGLLVRTGLRIRGYCNGA